MTRSAADAIAWGQAQRREPSKSWDNLCLQFVRMAFDVTVVLPDAGTSWDRSQFKHRVSEGVDVPRGVPVYWELPSVADHVALSLGNGRCLSNDVVVQGQIDVVEIDAITRRWGADLLGWTEDLNGVPVWTAPKPKPLPLPPTNVSLARDDVEAAARRLRKAIKQHGRGDKVVAFRRALLEALNDAPDR